MADRDSQFIYEKYQQINESVTLSELVHGTQYVDTQGHEFKVVFPTHQLDDPAFRMHQYPVGLDASGAPAATKEYPQKNVHVMSQPIALTGGGRLPTTSTTPAVIHKVGDIDRITKRATTSSPTSTDPDAPKNPNEVVPFHKKAVGAAFGQGRGITTGGKDQIGQWIDSKVRKWAATPTTRPSAPDSAV